ncbi:MAG: cation transporter [Opitutaceae bacterium]|nr:cation transporter [Opitutaceae bacterium]
MKKIQLLLLNAILLVFLLLGTQARAEVSHVSIAINGLGCPFCVYGLEKQLKKVDGVKKVDIELKTGLAFVTLENGTYPNISMFQNAVKKAGFTPQAVQITAIGKVQTKNDEMYLSLRGSDDKYLLFVKDSVNTDLPQELKVQLLELAESQTIVAITGTLHSHAQDQNGLTVEKLSALSSMALSVDGMFCEMCVARLKQLLEKRKDIYQASVSLADKRTIVEAIDATLNADELIETINDAGFSASVESDGTKQ